MSAKEVGRSIRSRNNVRNGKHGATGEAAKEKLKFQISRFAALLSGAHFWALACYRVGLPFYAFEEAQSTMRFGFDCQMKNNRWSRVSRCCRRALCQVL